MMCLRLRPPAADDLAHRNGSEPCVSPQPLYSLLAREVEWELVPVSLAEGVGSSPGARSRAADRPASAAAA